MNKYTKQLREIWAKSLLAVFVFNSTLVCAGQQKSPPVLKTDGAKNSTKILTGTGAVRSVTIPISVRAGAGRNAATLETGELTVREDGETQQVLSVRQMSETTPIALAVLIQDNVVSSVGNELNSIKNFVRRLPAGSRVFVGTIRNNTIAVRQKFTTDLPRAADALRPPSGFASNAPFNPYVEISEALKRFEGLPAGRRAMLVVSDGLDVSRGTDSASPTLSIDLQRAINEAQRTSVAVYSFYAPTAGGTVNGNPTLVNFAQGSLQRLADETGGRAFFEGTGAPVSFDPFLTQLTASLGNQLAVTYLSTHPAKGYHRIKILSDRSGVDINYPAGYTR